jgi:carboxymethylenebutenolidase
MKAPVIGFYGVKDQGIPVDRVEQLWAALKATHKPCKIGIYPDAQHGFTADYRPATMRPAPRKPVQRCWSGSTVTGLDHHFEKPGRIPIAQPSK